MLNKAFEENASIDIATPIKKPKKTDNMLYFSITKHPDAIKKKSDKNDFIFIYICMYYFFLLVLISSFFTNSSDNFPYLFRNGICVAIKSKDIGIAPNTLKLIQKLSL